MKGHARFLPSGPDGLFGKWAQQGCHMRNTEWDLGYVIDFLCPLQIMPDVTQIAGGLLAPGERASGQLRRLVRSFDSQSTMNILQLFVEQGSHYDTSEILEKLRMLHHVYGLSVLTPTQDGRAVRELAAKSHNSFSDHMREAVAMAVDEEPLEQRRALAAARGLALRDLPREPIEIIGRLSGLPLERAEGINEDIDQRRRARARRRNL